MKRLATSFMILILLLITNENLASGQAGTIVITGADDQVSHTFQADTSLNTLLTQIPEKFDFSYADSNRLTPLSLPALEFRNLLATVPSRLVILHGDTNTLTGLSFPLEMIGDTVSPTISQINVSFVSVTAYMVTWKTNEYARCAVSYRVPPAITPITITNNLYFKDHQATLSGLSIGTTVYYWFSCTDQSGNTRNSQEFNFYVAELRSVFLPFIKR